VFYVACTRAKESLIIALHDKGIADECDGDGVADAPSCGKERRERRERKGLVGDIEGGLFAPEGFPHTSTEFGFGTAGADMTGWYDYEVAVGAEVAAGGEVAAGASSPSSSPASSPHAGDLEPRIVKTVSALLPQPFVSPLDKLADCGLQERTTNSYSSLAKQRTAKVAAEVGTGPPVASGATKAPAPFIPLAHRDSAEIRVMDFGSAFHAAAQQWVEGGFVEMDLSPLAKRFRLTALESDRLTRAFGIWQGSARAKALGSRGRLFVEYPFLVEVPGTLPLEGRIDLLALDEPGGMATVIDYKTGVGTEEHAVLLERYRLQAQCYAYAVLKGFAGRGINTVELVFVRPEQVLEQGGQPDEVVYSFSQEDLPALLEVICA
jgi:hypothetical protein